MQASSIRGNAAVCLVGCGYFSEVVGGDQKIHTHSCFSSYSPMEDVWARIPELFVAVACWLPVADAVRLRHVRASTLRLVDGPYAEHLIDDYLLSNARSTLLRDPASNLVVSVLPPALYSPCFPLERDFLAFLRAHRWSIADLCGLMGEPPRGLGRCRRAAALPSASAVGGRPPSLP